MVGQMMERLNNSDDRRKSGQVELELWECSNLGTQGNEIPGVPSRTSDIQ